MTLPSQYKDELAKAVAAAAAAVSNDIAIDTANILERPRAEAHGDFSCPLPLMLAKRLKKNPRLIAEQITAGLVLPPFVAATEIAAPGFINFTVDSKAKTRVISEILAAGDDYGLHAPRQETVLLEFVSANPTGPLHVGHGRACVYGDALANILTAAGITVAREYYVNDAGRQIDILAASVWLRYWMKKSGETNMAEGAYRGDYLIAVANTLAPLLADTAAPPATLAAAMQAADNSDDAADLLVAAARTATAQHYTTLRQDTATLILDTVIKEDMKALNVDVENINFFHETTLHDNGKVAQAVETLQQRGELAEKDGALWFKSSAYGDEKDRVVRRSNGNLTYFAADIAYHEDKLSRPHNPQHDYKLINVLGADHHGYIARIAAVVQALGYSADSIETEIIQFVALFEKGVRLKMSTRAGEFITVKELVELVDVVGADAARYYYLNRKNDLHLDFDITAAKAQERKNPIYYLHYANARIFRIVEHWEEHLGGKRQSLADITQAELEQALANDSAAVGLCDALMRYPSLVNKAAAERAPHLLTVYLHELATQLHNFYEHTRILPAKDAAKDTPPDDALSARLALLWAVQTVFANSTRLLGLRFPESM